MKEIDTKPKPKVVNDEAIEESTPFLRILDEKHALDEKIIKLIAFLEDDEKACNVAGWKQVEKMREQIDVMLAYSNILNTRILIWKHNK